MSPRFEFGSSAFLRNRSSVNCFSTALLIFVDFQYLCMAFAPFFNLCSAPFPYINANTFRDWQIVVV